VKYQAAAETVGRVVEQLAVSPRPLNERVAEAAIVLERLLASNAALPDQCRKALQEVVKRASKDGSSARGGAPRGKSAEAELIDLALEVVRLEKELWHLSKEKDGSAPGNNGSAV
jgi:hypothetical protein